MSNWEKYLKDRLIKKCDGFVVIVPCEKSTLTPLCCPVCSYVMRTREDDESYQEFKCCERCALQWAHARKDAWKGGWRPSTEQIRLANDERPRLTIKFDID